jgi:hypothetical protein
MRADVSEDVKGGYAPESWERTSARVQEYRGAKGMDGEWRMGHNVP